MRLVSVAEPGISWGVIMLLIPGGGGEGGGLSGKSLLTGIS